MVYELVFPRAVEQILYALCYRVTDSILCRNDAVLRHVTHQVFIIHTDTSCPFISYPLSICMDNIATADRFS